MWEKIGKVHIVNVIALMVVMTCSFNAITGSEKEREAYQLMGFGAVMGWGFGAMHRKNSQLP